MQDGFISEFVIPEKTIPGGLSGDCILNASCVYHQNKLYLFGGFHYESDDVYNDLSVLDLTDKTWSKLAPVNPAPCKRTDHSMSFWQNHLIVFGGSDENDVFLNDLHMLDLTTLRWTEVLPTGTMPTPRIKHSATVHGDFLYISGGSKTKDAESVRELNILNLKTFHWEDPIPFLKRHAHSSLVLKNRLYVYGGFDDNMIEVIERITYIDLRTLKMNHLSFSTGSGPDRAYSYCQKLLTQAMDMGFLILSVPTIRQANAHHQTHLGSSSSMKGPAKLWFLSLEGMIWDSLGSFNLPSPYTWYYHTIGENSRVFLLGESNGSMEGYMSSLLQLNLESYGIVCIPPSTFAKESLLHDTESSDFTIIPASSDLNKDEQGIAVHKKILRRRWKYFDRLVSSGMSESESNSIRIDFKPPIVKLFLQYLYTDTLDTNNIYLIPDLMILANRYCMDRLQKLCCACLHEELDVRNAPSIFSAARTCHETALQKRTIALIQQNFGKVTRSIAFRELDRDDLNAIWDSCPVESCLLSKNTAQK